MTAPIRAGTTKTVPTGIAATGTEAIGTEATGTGTIGIGITGTIRRTTVIAITGITAGEIIAITPPTTRAGIIMAAEDMIAADPACPKGDTIKPVARQKT